MERKLFQLRRVKVKYVSLDSNQKTSKQWLEIQKGHQILKRVNIDLESKYQETDFVFEADLQNLDKLFSVALYNQEADTSITKVTEYFFNQRSNSDTILRAQISTKSQKLKQEELKIKVDLIFGHTTATEHQKKKQERIPASNQPNSIDQVKDIDFDKAKQELMKVVSEPICQIISDVSQAPKFMAHNLQRGYRIGFYSPKKIFKTIFMIHNQTVNIWSHLLGSLFLIFLVIMISIEMISLEFHESESEHLSFLGDLMKLPNSDLGKLPKIGNKSLSSSHFNLNSQLSVFPIIVFLISSAASLLCSAAFHLLYPMSEKVYQTSLSLDLAGIALTIAGSVIPITYYGLYCNERLTQFYTNLIVISGLIVFGCTFHPLFKHKTKRAPRITLFFTFTWIVGSPILHLMAKELFLGNDGDTFIISNSLPFYFMSFWSIATGMTIYAKQCPETNNPGRYDICGASHQLWHIFVLISIFFVYLGALVNYQTRKVSLCSSQL